MSEVKGGVVVSSSAIPPSAFAQLQIPYRGNSGGLYKRSRPHDMILRELISFEITCMQRTAILPTSENHADDLEESIE